MSQIVEDLSQCIPIRRACQALGLSHHALYRSRRTGPVRTPSKDTPGNWRALNAEEKAQVRSTLNSERFADQTPREIHATLLDEGTYLCSVSSMYRILQQNQEVCERRNQLRHPPFARPELLATAPNQIWTWDITKLLGPVKWTYFYLYVLLDLFSRFVVGWLIAARESSDLAQVLIAESCTRQNIQPQQLTLHADRGAAMIAKPLAALLADLGVSESHARPHVSNDNPFSEAQFKTMKYQPTYPHCFGSLPDARSWAQAFFPWYNFEHHHSGLGLMTRRRCTSAKRLNSGSTARLFCNRLMPRMPNGSSRGLPNPPLCQPPFGSTRPQKREGLNRFHLRELLPKGGVPVKSASQPNLPSTPARS